MYELLTDSSSSSSTSAAAAIPRYQAAPQAASNTAGPQYRQPTLTQYVRPGAGPGARVDAASGQPGPSSTGGMTPQAYLLPAAGVRTPVHSFNMSVMSALVWQQPQA
jgi:hypothetical protein